MTDDTDPSDDIEFGAVQESGPSHGSRPEDDPRLCVVGCQSPDDGDLPIYIDLDVVLDIHRHAQSDTRVELGGVMMGAVHEDVEGRSFVLVTDSIRAEHYEATKGSFKFTHETWQAISRRRDEYPDHVRMVGWYHTHPDWGVFLSGMDLFICQNFFAGTHDLALVVDPCRHDVGWFQWTTGREHPQRTGGFYLMASRHREKEARQVARQLEGKAPMSFDTSYSAPPASQPVIIQQPVRGGSLSPIEAGFVIGLLLQTALVALIAWRLLGMGESNPAVSSPVTARSAEDRRFEQAASARQQVIEQLLKAYPESELMAEELPRLQGRVNQLEAELSGQARAIVSLNHELQDVEGERDKLEKQALNRADELRQLQIEHRDTHARLVEAEGVIAEVRSEARAAFVWYSDWGYLACLAIAVLLGGALGGVGGVEWYRRKVPPPAEFSRPDSFEPLRGESEESTNEK
ncbi:MAG: Mov34/MPN/PAD-1 family protein [Pirellulaceae bacterium]